MRSPVGPFAARWEQRASAWHSTGIIRFWPGTSRELRGRSRGGWWTAPSEVLMGTAMIAREASERIAALR